MRNKLILGIIVGGVVGALLVLIFLVFIDGKTNKNRTGIQLVTADSTKTDDSKNQQVLVYGNYMDLDSTDYLLIPLGMKTLEKTNDITGVRSKSMDEYYGNESEFRSYKYNFYALSFGNCNNIIFYNKQTEETHLLLQKPAIISQFYFPYYDENYKSKKYWFLLMGVREYDSNLDGYINSDDAERVYITDLSGKSMTAITPDNTQLIDWFIDAKTNTILMKVRFDSNKDLKFNAYDDIEILKTSISSPTIGNIIIGKEIKNTIDKILDKIK
ncbi:MAG: hypothetical protein JNL69_10275 [Bacteroidia bacterium]|nr:hypothetical protein [Bacteroidia bacterium]